MSLYQKFLHVKKYLKCDLGLALKYVSDFGAQRSRNLMIASLPLRR